MSSLENQWQGFFVLFHLFGFFPAKWRSGLWVNLIYLDLVGVNVPYGSLPTWDIIWLLWFLLVAELLLLPRMAVGLLLHCRYNPVALECVRWHFNYFVLRELQINEISTHIPVFQCDILIHWLLFCSSSPMSAILPVLAMDICKSIFKLLFFHCGHYVLSKDQKQ